MWISYQSKFQNSVLFKVIFTICYFNASMLIDQCYATRWEFYFSGLRGLVRGRPIVRPPLMLNKFVQSILEEASCQLQVSHIIVSRNVSKFDYQYFSIFCVFL